ELGGQLRQMFHPVLDYPGLLAADGEALRDAFKHHVDTLSLNYRLGCQIESVDLARKAVVCNGETLTARALIIATGARQRRLSIPGEDLAHHVDANAARAYHHQSVCVIGGGDSAVENANILARTAAHVTLIHRSDRFRARAEWLAAAEAAPNLTILRHTLPLAIHADSIEVQNLQTGLCRTLPTAAIFIRAGIVPNTELFAGQIELNEAGYVRVFENQQTSLPMVYAVGDVAQPACLSVATAVGHAAVAVKHCAALLNSARFKRHSPRLSKRGK
ncbi:MAG: NAD(P)/FAD-dependent oxidoreductase, partial [Acidobacteria bacterium]|nr:NAD(P)/FAD-dependent oxidoreductase [Acidobacteriota bacterium]